MRVLVPEHNNDDLTNPVDISSWHAFSEAYYEPINRALRLLRVPDERPDLAHGFLLKAHERDFLDKYRAFQERSAAHGQTTKFRTYLYSSLRNYVRDVHGQGRASPASLDAREEAGLPVQAGPVDSLDADALYALDVLHQALQAMRRHCERSGKAHIWTIFEETFLTDELRGRQGKGRAELLAMFPGKGPQFLDNCLTTAKRTFRRIVPEVVPRSLRDDEGSGDRFREWMEILRSSHASQFNLLHIAYRVAPVLDPDMSEAHSSVMLLGGDTNDASVAGYEEPPLELSDDELGILLSFRLELPLVEMIDASDLNRYVPPSSVLWGKPEGKPSARKGPGAITRPLCLLTLVEPRTEEASALEKVNVVGLLERIKDQAKQLHRRPDHAMPEVFSQLLYTLVSSVSLIRHGTEMHSISNKQLFKNVKWFLKRSWIDDRLRPLFETAARELETHHVKADTNPRSSK